MYSKAEINYEIVRFKKEERRPKTKIGRMPLKMVLLMSQRSALTMSCWKKRSSRRSNQRIQT